MKLYFRNTLFSAVLLGMASLQSAVAAELIMLEQAACHWCERWHAEIGPIYPKTTEGAQAPLRLIDIHESLPEDMAGLRVERFTPSFVLMDKGVELGRIRGYPGEELFWWMLSDLLKKLPGDTSQDKDS